MNSKSSAWPQGESFKLELPPGTIVDALVRAATLTPDQPAIHFYGRSISYAQLNREVSNLANYLRLTLGVKRGDRVLLLLQNSPQFIIAYQAVLRCDAVVVSANPMYKTREIDHIVTDTQATIAFVGTDVLEQAAPLIGPRLSHVIVAAYGAYLPDPCAYPLPGVLEQREVGALAEDGSVLPWPDLSSSTQKEDYPARNGPSDLALLIYTSGSTGKPKACMHTHRSLLFTAYAQAKWYRVRADTVISGFQPLFHVAGMQSGMNTPIVAGVPAVIMTRWDRDVALKLIATHKVTFFNGPPAMVIDLLKGDPQDDHLLQSVAFMTGGGQAMPEAVSDELMRRTGLCYLEAYGMTESFSPTHINPMDEPVRRTVGIPIYETECRIIDLGTGALLGPGEIGEIVLAGPQIFQGYWRQPDATSAAFVSIDGQIFYRTGDSGWNDELGYLHMEDRIKRMINASGYKVWPAEVEELLYQHPSVLECAVISSPHSHRGEDVKAIVTLKPNQPAGFDAHEILDWMRERIAVYKAPRTIEVRTSLPRSPSNKVDWRVLKDTEWASKSP